MRHTHNPAEITIKLVVLKNKLAHGEVPVYLTYRQFGKTERLSLGRKVEFKKWTGKAPDYVNAKGRKKHPNSQEINFWLRSQYNKADKILLDAANDDYLLNFNEFRFKFRNGKNFPFPALHRFYVKEKIRRKVKYNTLRNYKTRLHKFMAFAPDATLKSINEDLIFDYCLYLSDESGNKQTTIYSAALHIKAVLEFAKKKKLIHYNPIEDFTLEKGETFIPIYLDEKEVQSLMQLHNDFSLPLLLRNSLQMFLAACFTGLDYGCSTDLDYNDFYDKEGGVILIKRNRCKNGNPYCVPLMKEATAVLTDKLKNLDNRQGKLFHKTTNQQTNENLKVLANMAGIDKRLTFHVGRHTFATMYLNRGIRKEVIKKMLGHKTDKQTDHYAKMLQETVIREMTAIYTLNSIHEEKSNIPFSNAAVNRNNPVYAQNIR